MSNAKKLADSLEALEAERIALQVGLRCDLIKAARELLDSAIAQAAAKPLNCKHCGKICGHTAAGTPALLRIISRLAMRDAAIDKARKR